MCEDMSLVCVIRNRCDHVDVITNLGTQRVRVLMDFLRLLLDYRLPLLAVPFFMLFPVTVASGGGEE